MLVAEFTASDLLFVFTHVQHAPGEDIYGYEDAGERWLPVHSVETVASSAEYRYL